MNQGSQNNQQNYKVYIYKSPLAAAMWSALLPGFGQLYVRDYIIGFSLVAWEIVVNIMSK
ncbi:hypothetical protein [Aquibacillus albus]|uniref:DUF5683 domain-containing protein n=1 Tax=Aquibacillus albus TaxID=1168171 RepID=A0ABS2N5W9_9BACI|nr:hypothetical protein [Aquibacillus albus]MBM7573285.1 hypothetical protein [Aquibacillus albus]